MIHSRGIARGRALGTALACTWLLTGCEGGFQPPAFLQSEGTSAAGAGGATVETRDVEAPEVFQVTEAAIWDGRPSLGGVWVAHPDVQEPERVLIRDQDTGNFVVGALFKRERLGPGPRLQVSSDAAEALELTASLPATLQVTALRQEDVPVAAPDPEAGALDTLTPIETAPLEEPTEADLEAIARAGIEAAEQGPTEEDLAATSRAAIEAAAAAIGGAEPSQPAASADAVAPSRPFVQVGIYSEEANARQVQQALEGAGLPARTVEDTLGGRSSFRVIAGPASSSQERERILAQVRSLGYADAYAVRS